MALLAARDIMTTGVVTVSPQDSLLEAAKKLSDHNFSGMPVVDKENILVGIITEYDFISKSAALHIPALPPEIKRVSKSLVKDVMNPDPLFLKEGASIEEVVSAFREHHRVNPVPVVNDKKAVVGIISRYNLIKILDEFMSKTVDKQSIDDAFTLLQKDYFLISKIAEAKISEDLQYAKTFEEAVRASSNAIVITDVDANIIYVNPAWERLNGYSLEEARGKNNRILQSGKTPKEVYVRMWEILIRGEPFVSEEVINKRKDGTEYCKEVTISPIKQNGNAFYIGITRDITKKKESDRAKTEFVSLTAHQLATPLTAISWSTDFLLGGHGGKLTPEQKTSLEQIYKQAKSLQELVELFLNITRIESGSFKIINAPMRPAEVADSIFKDCTLALRKNIKFVKTYDKNLGAVSLDERIFRIILQNFLTNAIKYTPEGGTVTIEIAKEDKNLLLGVKDTGCGIPEGEQGKVFTKLFRAKNARELVSDGTGLGLYLAKIMVDRIGGKIWFQSRENQGTAFYAELPFTT